MEFCEQLGSRGLVGRGQRSTPCTAIELKSGQHPGGIFSTGKFDPRNVFLGTLFWSRLPLCHSLSMRSSAPGETREERKECPPSACLTSPANYGASGRVENTVRLWEDFFADPSQWWDNRMSKRNPKSPDFKHRLTREALWIDGWSNPPWVKAKLIAMARGRSQSYGGSNDQVPRGVACQDSKRLFVNARSVWRRNYPSNGTEGLRQGVNNVAFDTSRQRRTLIKKGEASAMLQIYDQQGIPVDYHTYIKILQRPCKMKDLALGKQVHDHIIQSGVEPNVYLVNNLMKMYLNCGSVVDARQLFDNFLKKDVVTWTTMIGGYVQHDHGAQAFEVFSQMVQEGVEPDNVTYMSILNACAGPVALEWGKEVHAHIINAGLQSDVRVGTALVKMYAKSGSIKFARQVFDKIVNRNVIAWTVMIGSYAESGHGEEAFEVFSQMRQEGVEPNTITYLSILNPCASPGALEWVKEVHAQALQDGLEYDVRVGTALVKMYAKCGSIKEARQVFDKMINPNVITYTVMIEAYAESGHEDKAVGMFFQMRQKGLEPDGYVVNTLMKMYINCGSVVNARQLFDKLLKKDVVTWTIMIGGYVQHDCAAEAFEVFRQMLHEGVNPNSVTYMNILNACASSVVLDWGIEIHAHIIKAGLQSDTCVGTALVKMYAKCGSIEEAREVFNRIVKRDVISWNVMIGAYAESGHGDEAFEIFRQMQEEGLEPGAVTYLSILNSCASPGALEWVKEVHSQALKAGLESDVRVANALVNMYAKCGSIEDACQVFGRMVKHDDISWTVMIGGLAQHGKGKEALEIFEQMKREGFRPNEVTYMGVFSACSHAGLVDEGRHHFSSMSQEYGIIPTIEHYGCLVDLLGRAGNLDEAENIIKNMPVEADAKIWGALLGACRIHGNVKLAEHAAEHCLRLEPETAGVYVLLSNIYAAAGMWDQVLRVRNMMKERGVRKEPGYSWIRIDKKVHSFIVEDRSHPQTEEIYTELKKMTEKIKRAGYIPDMRFGMHDIEDQQKEEALCFHSERLAITYGLISTPPGTPICIFKNLRVCSDCHTATKFISKVSGREIVARDANRFHHFKDGMCSCGDYW